MRLCGFVGVDLSLTAGLAGLIRLRRYAREQLRYFSRSTSNLSCVYAYLFSEQSR